MVLYNAFLAVVIVCVCYVIGEWVADLSKAWIPSVLVTAILFLIGYWTEWWLCAGSGRITNHRTLPSRRRKAFD